MNILSSEPFIQSLSDVGVGLALPLKLSRDRGLSEPAVLFCIMDRFSSRVARAGSCDLFRGKRNTFEIDFELKNI